MSWMWRGKTLRGDGRWVEKGVFEGRWSCPRQKFWNRNGIGAITRIGKLHS